MLLHRSDLNISAKFVKHFGVFKIRNAKKFDKTSPFRNRVAKLRGPSEGLGGNAANV